MAVNREMNACSIPCNLCGGTEVSILSNRSRSGKPLRTVICRACGLVWSDPRPHDARRFYEQEYRLSYKHTYRPKLKHVLRAGNVALSRFEKIEQLLSTRKAVLDVGTGGGEFAYLLQSLDME
jgi:methylase of polypeptide subunit release factors